MSLIPSFYCRASLIDICFVSSTPTRSNPISGTRTWTPSSHLLSTYSNLTPKDSQRATSRGCPMCDYISLPCSRTSSSSFAGTRQLVSLRYIVCTSNLTIPFVSEVFSARGSRSHNSSRLYDQSLKPSPPDPPMAPPLYPTSLVILGLHDTVRSTAIR